MTPKVGIELGTNFSPGSFRGCAEAGKRSFKRGAQWRFQLRLDWNRRTAHVRLPERKSSAPCPMPSPSF
jgi:hypothetical protein